jgi:hypothetical protein
VEVFVDDYIAKLILLEKAVGHKAHYKVLEPFSLALGSGSDRYVEIQIAAKRIADFVELAGLTFLIEPVALGAGTCGRIELRSGSSEVFVQVSPDLFAFPDAILATLSHEISHKFLHVNGLSWGVGPANDYHNEVLTDITAVFLGLGKLMLNGRHVERIIEAGASRTIHTREVGYLNGDQLAFVYLLVCHMRRIAHRDFMCGLSSSSVYTVAQTSSTFRRYFRPELHKKKVIEAIRDESSVRVVKARQQIESFTQGVQRLRQLLSLTEISATERSQAQTNAIISELKDFENSVDPCLAYFSALRLDQLSQVALPNLQRAKRDIEVALSDIGRAKRHLDAPGARSLSLLSRLAKGFFKGR